MKTAIVLSSWKDAIEECESSQWEELNLEMANQFSERLAKKAPQEFAKWNDVVKECKGKTIPLVARKTLDVVNQKGLPKSFIDSVNWDILHLCLEAEFSDVCPPGYFASQGFWYIKGHFPCGWRGQFPEGKLVIY